MFCIAAMMHAALPHGGPGRLAPAGIDMVRAGNAVPVTQRSALNAHCRTSKVVVPKAARHLSKRC